MSRYRDNIRAAELRQPDHWPTCGRCYELSPPGTTVCVCGSRLTPPDREEAEAQ